ncbi:MAG: SDR family oxidoreductase [Gammaproteobacteria bacterium]|nr:SDR family oxidoreductase [Gammaproteobacteria bacterium]
MCKVVRVRVWQEGSQVTDRKTALITGCSTGIGRVAAETFQRSDWNVIASMRRPEAERELGVLERVLVTALDVTDPDSIDAAIRAGVERFGTVDCLVNNAGLGGHALLEQSSDRMIRAMYETNVFGPIRTTRAALPILRRQGGGTVVNVTSMGGLMGLPLDSIYCSTKFAMEGFTEALALECAPLGIRVCSVAPGAYLTTAFSANTIDELDAGEPSVVAYARRVRAHMQRVISGGGGTTADPQEVADVIYRCATSDMPTHNQVGRDAEMLMGLMRAGPRQAFVDQVAAMLLPAGETA